MKPLFQVSVPAQAEGVGGGLHAEVVWRLSQVHSPKRKSGRDKKGWQEGGKE